MLRSDSTLLRFGTVVIQHSYFSLSLPKGVLLMDFFQNATHDQIALMGCFVALVASAALMYVSVYLSRTSRQTQVRETLNRTIPMAARDERPEVETSHRKVA